MPKSRIARLLALLIALSAIVGIGIHLEAQWSRSGSMIEAIWLLSGYFTVLTNLLVAIVFAILAIRGPAALSPRIVGGVAIAIALVGVIYALLLRGLVELTAGAAVADVLLHLVTPILVPLYWLVFTAHGSLRPRYAFIWALYPLAYLAYALVRGAAEGHFAYPFLDHVKNGVPAVALTVGVIAASFLLCGWAMVFLDRRLAR